jgi:putative SOS response-associated peptidase YedK
VCGRITLTRPNFESIATELNVEPMNYRGYPIYEPHYNIAPTDTVPILTLADGQRFPWRLRKPVEDAFHFGLARA